MIFEQSFYISSLIKTNSSVEPNDLLPYQNKRGDFFYVRYDKESDIATALGVIAVSAASIAIIVNTANGENIDY